MDKYIEKLWEEYSESFFGIGTAMRKEFFIIAITEAMQAQAEACADEFRIGCIKQLTDSEIKIKILNAEVKNAG